MPKIEIDPEIYMALHLSCEMNDGIGAARMYGGGHLPKDWVIPCCLTGHANWIAGDEIRSLLESISNSEKELTFMAGGTVESQQIIRNDSAIRAINLAKGRPKDEWLAKVTWEEYVEQRQWVPRGEWIEDDEGDPAPVFIDDEGMDADGVFHG